MATAECGFQGAYWPGTTSCGCNGGVYYDYDPPKCVCNKSQYVYNKETNTCVEPPAPSNNSNIDTNALNTVNNVVDIGLMVIGGIIGVLVVGYYIKRAFQVNQAVHPIITRPPENVPPPT